MRSHIVVSTSTFIVWATDANEAISIVKRRDGIAHLSSPKIKMIDSKIIADIGGEGIHQSTREGE